MKLVEPECRLGYPLEQVKKIVGDNWPDFDEWIRGQTCGVCDGQLYDHQTKSYVPTLCGPHGVVVYPYDLKHFVFDGGLEAPIYD